LYVAAQEGHLAVVRCLVKEFGADVNQARLDGVTPSIVAARCGHEDVIAFLIKYGANIKCSALEFGTAAD
jgi:ankyrin repeat protein